MKKCSVLLSVLTRKSELCFMFTKPFSTLLPVLAGLISNRSKVLTLAAFNESVTCDTSSLALDNTTDLIK